MKPSCLKLCPVVQYGRYGDYHRSILSGRHLNGAGFGRRGEVIGGFIAVVGVGHNSDGFVFPVGSELIWNGL